MLQCRFYVDVGMEEQEHSDDGFFFSHSNGREIDIQMQVQVPK